MNKHFCRYDFPHILSVLFIAVGTMAIVALIIRHGLFWWYIGGCLLFAVGFCWWKQMLWLIIMLLPRFIGDAIGWLLDKIEDWPQ